MIAAPTRDDTVPASTAVCPRCGTARESPTLLTSMTSYYVCGACAARWSVARDWLAASIQRTR